MQTSVSFEAEANPVNFIQELYLMMASFWGVWGYLCVSCMEMRRELGEMQREAT